MKCAICKGEIGMQDNGYTEGHNAMPLSKGRCCTKCNDTEVMPMRMAFIHMGRPIPTTSLKDILKEQRKAKSLASVSLKAITKEINEKKKKGKS